MRYTIKKDATTQITSITLNNGPLSATFLDYGARWHQFLVPDKYGKVENIILSLDSNEGILTDQAQFGSLIGPVAGRISAAKWGAISLDKNCGDHHIHGGSHGWSHQFWDFKVSETAHSIKVIFTLIDNTSGYPGPIHVTNTYELTQHGVNMKTLVTSRADTIINPTNHVYFNLSGESKHTIKEHFLKISSSQMLETTKENIPTGKIIDLSHQPYDFSKTKKIGDALNHLENGIDDTYLLNERDPQIELSETISGRKLTLSSNRQSVVVFTTTGFNAPFKVNGQPMTSELGIALETQELPDITNHPEWGSILLPKNQEVTYYTNYGISYLPD